MDTLDKRMTRIPGEMEQDNAQFCNVTQNSTKFKIMNLLFLGISI
jgi:hypothetical protein